MPTQWTVSSANSRLIFLTIQVISAIPSHAATVLYELAAFTDFFLLTLDRAVYVLSLCMVLFKFLAVYISFYPVFKSYFGVCTFYIILLFHV